MTWKTIRTTALSSLALLALLATTQPLIAGELSGKWNFTWNTDGGDRESVVEFAQTGEKLSAKMADSDLAGEAKGGVFKVAGQFYSPEAGYSAPLTISGKQEGEKLVGNGQWDSHGMTFSAVRAE